MADIDVKNPFGTGAENPAYDGGLVMKLEKMLN